MAVVGIDIEVLPDDECRALLGRAAIGRLGLSIDALPVILPVNYVFRGDDIVFCTEPGSKLAAAARGAVACIEIDGIDGLDHTGWSVLATGRLSEIVDPAELAEASQLPLRPWAGGRHHYVRLGIELLSGRRITHS